MSTVEENRGADAPLVAIIMGSDSDLPVMSQAAVQLEKIGVPFEVTIVSAHRTPGRMYEFARGAAARGIAVIIAGAGGAAHLPGMVAALTTLPVIGVPVSTATLSGLDSLLSIVQMPAGIPVATVAINGARNAGLLAARIVAIGRPELRGALEQYANSQRDEVEAKAERLESGGFRDYLAELERKRD